MLQPFCGKCFVFLFSHLATFSVLLCFVLLASPPPTLCIHTWGRTLSLCLLCFSLCVGSCTVVSADVSYHSFSTGEQRAFPSPPYWTPCRSASPPRAPANLHLCVYSHTCMSSRTGCLNRKSRLARQVREHYSQGSLLTPPSLSFFFFFSATEGCSEETWHSICHCTNWLPMTHAATFGAQLVSCSSRAVQHVNYCTLGRAAHSFLSRAALGRITTTQFIANKS